MNKTTQATASIGRQILAVLVSVYGVLSASVSQLHLPSVVSTILVATGPLILAIEHFVSDPSTGTASTVVTAAEAEPDGAKIAEAVHAELTRLAASAAAVVNPPAAK